MIANTESAWNSLEVMKLLIGIMTPLSVLAIGFWLNRRMKTQEHLQWARQKVIEKRLDIYEEIAPLLNDLVCYFTFIGSWKEMSPPQIVQLKRQLDRIAYVNAPLLPPDFLNHYNTFIHACYQTYTGWGSDAKLRTTFKRREEAAAKAWKKEWATCFADEQHCSDPKLIQNLYSELVDYFAAELGVKVRAERVKPGRIPANIE